MLRVAEPRIEITLMLFSKDTYRNDIKAFRIVPQPIDSLQPLDDILANVIHINSRIS